MQIDDLKIQNGGNMHSISAVLYSAFHDQNRTIGDFGLLQHARSKIQNPHPKIPYAEMRLSETDGTIFKRGFTSVSPKKPVMPEGVYSGTSSLRTA